jgi:hypothetical protein
LISKIGGAIGINMDGVDGLINKISDIQADVKAQSFFGGSTTAPTTPSERSALIQKETTNKSEVTIKDETNKAVLTKKPDTANFNLKMMQSGAF